MGYQIIIKAGKRRYKKLLGLALGFVAALHKKGRPLMMEASVGDDALIYTRGKRVLAFAKRWLAWWWQEPEEGYLDRLGAPGHVAVAGDVRNVLIKAFKNGLLLSIRHPDGTWGSVDGSTSCDEVIIPEFQAQSLPGWYIRSVYLVKATDDGRKICLLVNTAFSGGEYPAVPATLTYDGTWQATVPLTGSLGAYPILDYTTFQTVACQKSSSDSDFTIYSCRGSDEWYSETYEDLYAGNLSPSTSGVRYGVADSVVVYTTQNFADPTDAYDAAVLRAAVFYAGDGTVTKTFDTGDISCHAGAYTTQGGSFGSTSGRLAKCRVESDPVNSRGTYSFILRSVIITNHVWSGPGANQTHTYYGTIITTVYGARPGGAIATLAQETYSGIIHIYSSTTGYSTLHAPQATFDSAGYYDPAVTLLYGSARSDFYRGADGNWVVGPVTGPNERSYTRLAPDLRAWTNGLEQASYVEWNSGSLYASGGAYASVPVVAYKCLPHGTFEVLRVMDGTLIEVAVRHSEFEWDSAVLVRGSDGAYITVCQVSGAEIKPFANRVLPAANPTHSVVAVFWSSELGVGVFDIFWKQGSTYERIYRDTMGIAPTSQSGAKRFVGVSEDGKLVLCGVEGWHRAFSIKYGELEEGEERVTVLEELFTGSRADGAIIWPLVNDDGSATQEGGFFNGQDGRAFQSLEDRPDPPTAARPTVIKPEEGEAYMFGSGMVLKYLLEAPPPNE